MKVAIIGAGYTGLSIGKELIKKKYDVTIFEKSKNVGGMCDTVLICGTHLEKYYRHIFKSDVDAVDLIKELGLEEDLIWPGTKMGYLSNNKIYEFGTPISLLKFKPISFLDKIRFGLNVIRIKLINDYKKIEKYTAEEWLKPRIGERAYSKIWEPLLISKFGEQKSEVSMAWLWGKIKLRSTSSTKEGEQLGYIKGSYQVLTDAFYNYLIDKGVRFELNTAVKKVEKKDDEFIVDLNNKKSEKFDYVVSTLDYETSVKVLGDLLCDAEKKRMSSVKYTSARTMLIVANKSFSRFYWTNIGDNDIPFGGIIEHTNMIKKDNYQGKTIIYISNYMTEKNPLYDVTKEDMLKEYMKHLSKINPEFTNDNIIEYHVYDQNYAQPIITCNYSKIIQKTKLKTKNLYLCTMPQIYPEDRGMNYAIKMGKKVANEIIKS